LLGGAKRDNWRRYLPTTPTHKHPAIDRIFNVVFLDGIQEIKEQIDDSDKIGAEFTGRQNGRQTSSKESLQSSQWLRLSCRNYAIDLGQ
jgi:hypothetical protein